MRIPQTEIVRIVTGSKLYGTDTEKSDTDISVVVFPSERDILLGRGDFVNQVSPAGNNNKDSVDVTTYSIQRFYKLLANMNMPAWEMVSASKTEKQLAFWEAVKEHSGYLINKKVRPVIKYLEKGMREIEDEAFDPKRTAHSLRLAHQALHLLRDGVIDFTKLPVELLMAVRETPPSDTIGQQLIYDRLASARLEVLDAVIKSDVREKVSSVAVEEMIIEAHRRRINPYG